MTEIESTKTATLVRDNLPNFNGHAALYRLDPPLAETDYDYSDDSTKVVAQHIYVVVSATVVPYIGGTETYIFGADAEGKVASWGELDGSYKGGLSHEVALTGAGYRVVSPAKTEQHIRVTGDDPHKVAEIAAALIREARS